MISGDVHDHECVFASPRVPQNVRAYAFVRGDVAVRLEPVESACRIHQFLLGAEHGESFFAVAVDQRPEAFGAWFPGR
jgi:hypothetical protein